ncbi:sterile alpha motif domain-containing protein 9-like [Liolophura sinensis]|uniref:sterile alpha motif domain-containing protein 9-like n=1 Tax=Liolophura sinensis TaxID=3198878 RepID=UPI0031587BB5
MTEEELEKLFPFMPFGHRKKLYLFRKEFEFDNDDDKVDTKREEQLEEFDKATKPTSCYKQHSIIRGKDTRVTNMMNPVHKFVGPETNRCEKNPLINMASEVVRFSAACLNSRTNGTIHFGINSDGEILGMQTDETKFRETFDKAIEDGFFHDQHSIVKRTIRPPKFIEVLQADVAPKLHVVEVDVVPSFSFTGEEAFFIQTQSGSKKKQNATRLLVFDKDEVKDLTGDDIRTHMDQKKRLSEARKGEEMKDRNKRRDRHCPDLDKKFVQLFCGGMNSLGDSDVYPILVCGKPNDKSRAVITDEAFDFLSRRDWTVVMDLDDCTDDKSLYNLYELGLSKTTTVLTSDDFDPRSSENTDDKNHLKSLYEDLTTSLHPPWVFLNGYAPLNKESYPPSLWKRKRSIGFIEVLRFFHAEIPEGRAVIVILLLSKDDGVLPEICDEICRIFDEQWMVLAEESNIADSLKSELVRRNVEKESLEHRFVVGIPWKHVAQIAKQLKGSVPQSECCLTTSTGASCVLKDKVKGKLTDLNILSRTECDDSRWEAGDMEKFSKDEEARFYRGDEASWWNFWFKDHVCQRKQHGDLLNQVRKCLEGDLREGDKVGRVHFYHHPGSGGTTSAKHVLWELREYYRCCLVKQLSNETCDQISKLRLYEDGERPKPVLVLVDNLDEERVDQLYAELEEAGRQSARSSQEFSVFCVMLICYRRTKSATAYQDKLVWLTHDLPTEELQWFKKKYSDLERNHREKSGVDPKTLIAFNIMKENFNTEYIKRAVRKFLEDITDSRERNLLKYVSLINSFDIDFHPVPLSSFDPIMLPARSRKYPMPSWEAHLSTCVRVLLNQKPTQGLRGQIKGLRVFSSLMSKEILQSLLDTTDVESKPQTVSEAMIEFLNSSVMKSKDNSNKQIWKMIRNLMKKRAWLKPGRLEKFSPLITAIRNEEGVDEAAEVMITVFERTDDPMVAQCIARLFIQAENWRKAEDYAKICTHMRPSNSCVWDTFGQVYKSKIEALYNRYVKDFSTSSAHEPTKEDLEAIAEAFTGIEIFRKEQRVSKTEKTMAVSNKVGYFSELQITLLLLDLLGFLTPFDNKENLHRFLVHQDFIIPEAQRRLGPELCDRLKELFKGSCDALISLEDEFLHLKDGTVDAYRRGMHRINKNRLIKLKEYHDVHFGESQDKIPLNMSPEDAAAFRRRRVIRLGGLSLGKILDVRDMQNGEATLGHMHGLLLQNIESPKPESFDFKGIIGVSLALSTLKTNVSTIRDLIRWSHALYGMVKDDDDRIELEAYLYMVMFHWPTGDGYDRSRCPSGTLQTAIKRWKLAFYRLYPWQKEVPPIKKKETTIYHLGNGSDMNQYTHFEQLHGRQGRRLIKGAQIWTNPETVRRLRLLQGTLINQGNDVQISFRSSEGSMSQITIPSGMPIHDKSIWNKHVFFFLGFSWAGPRAYGISGDDPRQMVCPQASSHQPVPVRPYHQVPGANYDTSVEVTSLLIQLRRIAELKHVHRQKGYLPPDQWNLVRQEGSLKEKLNALVSARSEVFSETQLPYESF